MKLQFKPAAGAAAVGLLLAGGDAMAQTSSSLIDVTSATQQLQNTTQANMTAIGAVLFILAALAMAIVWAKATFFG